MDYEIWFWCCCLSLFARKLVGGWWWDKVDDNTGFCLDVTSGGGWVMDIWDCLAIWMKLAWYSLAIISSFCFILSSYKLKIH